MLLPTNMAAINLEGVSVMRVKIRATMLPWFFSISRKIRSDEIKAISIARKESREHQAK